MDSGRTSEQCWVHGELWSFERSGRGPEIVLVHGLGAHGAAWDRVSPILEQHFTVISPDLPGHGRSSTNRSDFSPGGYANALRDFLDAIGAAPVALVGHSYGGTIVMQFAYQFPHLTPRVVLIAAPGLEHSISSWLRLLAIPGAGAIRTLDHIPSVETLLDIALTGLSLLRVPAPLLHELGRVANSVGSPARRAALLGILRTGLGVFGAMTEPVLERYPANIPTLLIWGEHDFVLPTPFTQGSHARIPRSSYYVAPQAGHSPHRSHPGLVAEHIVAFVG